MSRKYAIYGGSFDPIHNGHITLAGHAVRECGLDKLIFMPAYVSPFKQDKDVTGGSDRCSMIEKVLPLNAAFRLSRYELNRESPSYTIETLRHWDSMLEGELCFVLGFDSMVQVDKWYEGEEILRNYHLITCIRPDTDYTEGMHRVEEFRAEYSAEITILKMPPVDISSTVIRERASSGEPLTGMVPKGVEEYIIEHDLYKK